MASRHSPSVTSNGNGFPAPPKCLHELGRFRGNREEPGSFDEDVESASHQPFEQKSADSREIMKPLLNGCNSRRLHHLSFLKSAVYGPVPRGLPPLRSILPRGVFRIVSDTT